MATDSINEVTDERSFINERTGDREERLEINSLKREKEI